MSTYVDPLVECVQSKDWPYKKSCHMYATSTYELHKVAKGIGLKREWFQGDGEFPHYDLTGSKRIKALATGEVHETSVEFTIAFKLGFCAGHRVGKAENLS